MKTFYWNDLALLPRCAAWRASTRTLFVADVHVGKAATFRAAGLPAPAGTTRENLARLDALIDALQPRPLAVLGDLFHARQAYCETTLSEFAGWRRRRAALAIVLVAGNHDLRAGPPPAALGLELVDEPYALEGLECRHLPIAQADAAGPPSLAGHIHPATSLHGPGHDRLRLPCFVLRGRQLILPAFGEFTGGAAVRADDETALCVVAGEHIIHIPRTASRARGRG